MDIRALRYFLEIAREGSMTKAAARLFVTQPTLSRQMKDLEEELGKKLFVRSSYSLELTNEGMLLRKRAEDILDMVKKTTDEFKTMGEIISGDIYIGCAESYLIKYLAYAVGRVQENHPDIKYHVTSGGTTDVAERLQKGLLDFAIIVEPPDLSQYNYLEIPEKDIWGVVMRQDCPLAGKQQVSFDDLKPYNVFCSAQSIAADLPRWCGERVDQLKIMATFNLSNNAAVFAKAGLGCAVTFDRLVDTSPESGLCFRPLVPELATRMYVIWKKYQVFSPAAELLLKELQQLENHPLDKG